VDVQTGSEKLKDRARRIITIVTGLEYDQADKLLRRAKWDVKAAIVMQKSGLTLSRALAKLRGAHDVVRDAIGEDVEPRLGELLLEYPPHRKSCYSDLDFILLGFLSEDRGGAPLDRQLAAALRRLAAS